MSAAEAFKSSLLTFAKFGAAIHIVREYLFEISICIGPSMKPTFEGNGEFVIVEKISKRMGWLSRGDIVVCKSPLNAKEFVCKRIIGMPQDLLYADRRMSSLYQIPEGQVWIEGDNTSSSTDSRSYGAIPISMVKGRVCFQVGFRCIHTQFHHC
eukprot:TRINITY_DN4039_c0_g3_i1.p1 TRINITY_DN4039_c0_g3~~TRINITY_DN4039_c0_g3_i1.p1  ORF type:complete len:154 (+),score=25.17 TRINITY_DN4039_c0_g3_i1:96-557(+)